MPETPRPHRIVKFAVLALAAVYATWFSLYTCIGHGRFKTWAFDLGTFDQGIWLAGHSTDQFVTVRGLPLLGDHVRFFSFVLAPIYWIWDDVRFLLILQSVAIAAGAWFLCRIALREMPGRPWLALAISASWLLHPAVQNLNLDHAHPDAFATTLILAAVDFVRAGRLLPFAIAAALAMSCKEDVPLVFAALGAAMMLDRRQRRLGLVIASVSTVYFALCMAVILPHFNGYGFFRFGSGGFLSGFWNRGDDPGWLFGRIFGADSFRYLFEIGLPNLYLFLLSPLSVVPAVPALVANLVSDAWYMRSLEFHYQTSVVPFLFLGTIVGLSRIDVLRAGLASAGAAGATAARVLGFIRTAAPVLLLGAAVATNVGWSRAPLAGYRALRTSWKYQQYDPHLTKVRELIASIPKDAVVSADYSTVPHLSHRRFIYMFPNPFRISNWGIAGQNTHDPESVEYILLRNVHSGEDIARTIENLVADGRFVRVDGDAKVGLYERIDPVPLSDRASCGDWTGDGEITQEDVKWIAGAIMKHRPCPLSVCDADGDGELRYPDVLRIGRRLKDPAAPLSCPP